MTAFVIAKTNLLFHESVLLLTTNLVIALSKTSLDPLGYASWMQDYFDNVTTKCFGSITWQAEEKLSYSSVSFQVTWRHNHLAQSKKTKSGFQIFSNIVSKGICCFYNDCFTHRAITYRQHSSKKMSREMVWHNNSLWPRNAPDHGIHNLSVYFLPRCNLFISEKWRLIIIMIMIIIIIIIIITTIIINIIINNFNSPQKKTIYKIFTHFTIVD